MTKRRPLQIAIGLALVGFGLYLAFSPLVVADILSRPHETSSQMINLRASWGGPVIGLGALVAWLPALRPWPRTVVAVLLWAMAGIACARAIGFVLDGQPDGRQWLWMTLEIAIVIGCVIGLRSRRFVARD
jgi:hypothetical protein